MVWYVRTYHRFIRYPPRTSQRIADRYDQKQAKRMATNQHRTRDPGTPPESKISAPDYSPDDVLVADAAGETDAEIARPFEQGNSIVLAVTKYFEKDQPLFLFERHMGGRTCLIIEEAPEP